MYLVTRFEDEAMVEASLGGHVTAEEIGVFGDDLLETVRNFEGQPYHILLDYSRAKALDRRASAELARVKDQCRRVGAWKIVSVLDDESELIRHTSVRLQAVLEGREEFVSDPRRARFPRIPDPEIA